MQRHPHQPAPTPSQGAAGPPNPIKLYINVAKRSKAWSRTYSHSAFIENKEAWPISAAPRLNPRHCLRGRQETMSTTTGPCKCTYRALSSDCSASAMRRWRVALCRCLSGTIKVFLRCWLHVQVCWGKCGSFHGFILEKGRAIKWEERMIKGREVLQFRGCRKIQE